MINDQLGFYPISIDMPLLIQLQAFNFAILFLGLIFRIVITLFIAISILLIYSLLQVNVESRTYEIGVKRMMGLQKTTLIVDIISQTFLFVIPGIVVAFLLSFPCLRLIFFYAFEDTMELKMSSEPTIYAIMNALIIGIFIPLVSSLIPIKEAMKKNLNEALDYNRSKTKGAIIKILEPG